MAKEGSGQAALVFRGVSHSYGLAGNELPVLQDINLSVAPGEFVALLGPSGCGKSTLLRLAAGLEPLSEGTLGADGKAIENADPSRILVFQDPTLFPWRTVRDNIAIGPQARGVLDQSAERIDAALKLVKLEDFADSFPHQLSGGMAQRAALARALVNDPHVLLLDEPLGRLDSLTRLTMQRELLALWQRSGFAVVMVTHDVEEALLLAQRVIVLSDRPARIRAEIEVNVAYPRRRDDPAIIELRHSILETMGYDE
ncbi:MAG: ABC transporter ATP-binding protein [Mesorhizobium sp.]